MKKIMLLWATMILFTLAACNSNVGWEEPIEEGSIETLEIDDSAQGDSTNEDEKAPETSTAEEDKTEKDGFSTDEMEEQMGEAMPAIDIHIDQSTSSFGMNGVFINDSIDQVIRTLGEPQEQFDDDRYDYTFLDAWYSEKMMVVFDDVGVNYIQADTNTEDGKLLTESFINNFGGEIYQATDEQESISTFVFVPSEESLLVIEKYEDENTGVARSYMLAHIDHWSFARAWDMETIMNKEQFVKVDAATVIAQQ